MRSDNLSGTKYPRNNFDDDDGHYETKAEYDINWDEPLDIYCEWDEPIHML